LLLHNATGLYAVLGILDEPMHVITMHPCQGVDNVNSGSMAFTHLSTQRLAPSTHSAIALNDITIDV